MRNATVLLIVVLSTAILWAQGHDVVLPYVPPPQSSTGLRDPVTLLARRLQAGQATLALGDKGGLLASVLRELKMPVSSQTLVFSKTSLQHEDVTPRTPRALYFNDNVYLGFVPDGDRLELSAVDPAIGAVFYTVSQRAGARPSLVTDATCLQCHAVPATLGVAGHVLRSVFVRPDGRLVSEARSYLTDHRSPMEERWGGWFVSGTLSGNMHMGNALLRPGQSAASFDRAPGTNISSVSSLFSSDLYPSPHSDVVALMVLAHQVRMHNLIARLHYDATQVSTTNSGERLPPLTDGLDELVRYLLFADEAALKGPVSGPTTFAKDFEQLGPRDTRGRSLRQFDLRSRLFRYPCSYLVYSEAFLALPKSLKDRIYTRMAEVLSGRDTSPVFSRLQPVDRTAITEILKATHPEFAAATR